MNQSFELRTITEILNASKTNTVYAQSSFSQILGMLAHGSDEAMIEKLYKIGFDKEVPPTDKMFNAVWIDKSLSTKKKYEDTLITLFCAVVSKVNFIHEANEVAKQINRDVNEHTKGIISELMEEKALTDKVGDCLAIYLNTITHSAKWDTPFDKTDTYEDTFYGDSGQTKAQFMQQTEVHYILEGYEGADIIGVGDNTGAVFFVLPKTEVSMADMLKNLPDFKKLSPRQERIRIHIPKFDLTSKHTLTKLLDFWELTPFRLPSLGIAGGMPIKMIQNASFKIDEFGSTGAAATAAFVLRAMPPLYKFNRPFAFFSVDQKLNYIFAGKVVDF